MDRWRIALRSVALLALAGAAAGSPAIAQDGRASDPRVATPAQYDSWIAALQDADWERRIRAAWCLAAFRPAPIQAMEPLLDCIFD